MIPQSIRWRLPLSYAAIALLTALSLGGVLLSVLCGYYVQLEVDYLVSNLHTIANAMEQAMTQANVPPEALQAQVEGLSFLSQSRVRLLDANRDTLADSGPFDLSTVQIALGQQMVSPNVMIKIMREEIDDPDDPPFLIDGEPSIEIITVTGLITEATSVLPSFPTSPGVTIISATGAITGFDYTVLPGYGIVGDSPGFTGSLPAIEMLQGLDLSAEAASVGRRSGHEIRRTLHDADGNLLGYVQLSEGPAYGSLIVNRVAQGWMVAGAISVLLAAAVGWFISRNISTPLLNLTRATTRMAEGDLAARTDVTNQNEFGSLARSFNQMAEQVEETVVTLRRFVSNAAHEIHTPLTALRTNLELAPGDEFVHRAQAQVRRLELLTEGLLNLSRIEASEQVARAPVELVPLTQEMSELYASRAEQAGLTFELVLPDTPVTVWGDEAQLRRALGNLLDNGVKFTPEGGTVNVTLGLEKAGEWAALSVQDSGIGIPTDDLPHLFSRFHRGRNAAAYPGSGLGLAIVKAIVEGHGGQVSVEDAAPGTRFTLRLPVLERQ
ncbi:MAG: HAMP domain-containing histidine kinase [Chloroflexi bacterium]|nr:HAMP domain-containing histidine kinase [Chloroflexota bacterium]